MKRLFASLAIAATLFGALPVAAQDATTPDPIKMAEAKSTLTIANATVAYGRSKKDPLAMLSGVQMMIDALDGTTLEMAGKPLDLGAILDEAVAMAPDDQLIVARADALRDEAETRTRGACYWELWCDYYGYCEYWYVCY